MQDADDDDPSRGSFGHLECQQVPQGVTKSVESSPGLETLQITA